LDDIEDQGGLFIETGDLLVVTGRQNNSASQDWNVLPFDQGILGTGNDILL
jgi:hypothetical protein